jgi:hypothetical protein
MEHVLSGHIHVTYYVLGPRISACYMYIIADPLCKRYCISLLPLLLMSNLLQEFYLRYYSLSVCICITILTIAGLFKHYCSTYWERTWYFVSSRYCKFTWLLYYFYVTITQSYTSKPSTG